MVTSPGVFFGNPKHKPKIELIIDRNSNPCDWPEYVVGGRSRAAKACHITAITYWLPKVMMFDASD